MRTKRQTKPRKQQSTGTRYPRLRDLLDLALAMRATAEGLSLSDIEQRFKVSRRTAERMRDAILDAFRQTEEVATGERVKRWRIRDRAFSLGATIRPDDLAAFESIDKLLRHERREDLRTAARRVTDAIRASMDPKKLVRAETDVAALAEAEAMASRPGPTENIKPDVLRSLIQAIKACTVVRITHWTADSARPSRGHEVEPLGFLYGNGRRYLAARSRYHGDIHIYRMSRIDAVENTEEMFNLPKSFSMAKYAMQSFGVFQEKPMNVVLRFLPQAARDAKHFEFHASQKITNRGDGSVLVRFRAGGLNEICWHLFTWGGAVEIISPQRLRTGYKKLLSSTLSTLD